MEIEEKNDEKIGNIKKEYFEYYFGRSKDYYIQELISQENGKKFSFNIGAFFFGIFWALFRRLYIHSCIIFLVVVAELKIEKSLLSRLENTQDVEKFLRIIWLILFLIIIGYFGNFFYIKNSKKKIQKIISSPDDEIIKIKKLKKSGRGNWILVLSIILLFVLAKIIAHK